MEEGDTLISIWRALLAAIMASVCFWKLLLYRYRYVRIHVCVFVSVCVYI